MTKEKYCPNCSQFVKPHERFSVIAFIILLFVSGLGIIYLIICLFLKSQCPICKTTKLLKEKPKGETYKEEKMPKKAVKEESTVPISSIFSLPCPYCGEQIETRVLFCPFCGANVEEHIN